MPPVPVAHLAIVLKAALAFVIMGLTAMTAVTVVGFPNDYYNGLKEFVLTPPEYFLPAEFSLNYGQNGENLELQQLFENKPTPTLTLKISYAAPSHLHPARTPTPPSSPKAKDLFANTTNGPVSSPFQKLIAPLPGASMLDPYLVWHQIMFAYTNERLYALNTMISRVIKQRDWWIIRGIVCAVICFFGLTAMTAMLLRGWRSRNCKQTKGKALGQRSPSQDLLHQSNLTQLLEQLKTMIFENRRNPNHIVAMTGTILSRYFDDEKQRRSDWQAMVIRTAETRMKETLTKRKARINRIANQEFKRLRAVHAAELKATYERDVHAAAERYVLTAAGKRAEQDTRLSIAEKRVRGEATRGRSSIGDISESNSQGVIESDVDISSNKGKVKEKSAVEDVSHYISSEVSQQFAVPIAFRYRSDSDLEADPKWYEYLASLDKPDAEQEHSRAVDEVPSDEGEGEVGRGIFGDCGVPKEEANPTNDDVSEENTSFEDDGALHDDSVPRVEGMEPKNDVVGGRRSTEDTSQAERTEGPQKEAEAEGELQKPSTEDADDGPPPLPTMT